MGLGLGIGLLIGARAAATSMFLAALVAVLLCGLLLIFLPSGSRPVLLCLAVGVLASTVIGYLRNDAFDSRLVVPPENDLTVAIISDPRLSTSGSHVVGVWSDDPGREHEVRLFLPVDSKTGRGDTVIVSGRVSLSGDTPTVSVRSLRVVSSAGSLGMARRSIRDHSASTMTRFVPGSPGSLTLGLLIGDDTGLSPDERQSLRASGLAHITAVSGWNVSVIVVCMGAVFRALGARHWTWLALQLAIIATYVWIVGFEPPIVRAGIMGAVALTALHVGRPSHMYTHLILTAGIMAALNPSVLESVSFQLSFLAMIGLAVAGTLCSNLSGWQAVVALPAVTTAAASIATAPLLAATFGSLPLLSVPANLLAGQLVSIAAFAGMFVVAFSWFWPVAEIAGWFAWTIASLILWISMTVARFPGGYHEFAPLSSGATLLIYAALAVLAGPFFPETRALGRKASAWIGAEPRIAMMSASVFLMVIVLGVLMVRV